MHHSDPSSTRQANIRLIFVEIELNVKLQYNQTLGRYEEQFIERRRLQLQSFVSRVCNHPILSRSDVWLHFLTCTDAKRWKSGKRKAEKDEVIGAAIFGVVQVPEKALDPLQL